MSTSAKTSTDICPDLVDAKTYGNHTSVVVRGTRIWEFETEKQKLRFLKAVNKGAFTRKWALTKRIP